MKHGQNNRRQRSRGNNRRYPNQRGNSFESNGPEVKVRGTAQQVLEKYQSLARDAFSSGDRVLAEGYLQHAEHYYRILNADGDGQQQRDNQNRDNQNRDNQNRDNGRGRNNKNNRRDHAEASGDSAPVKDGETPSSDAKEDAQSDTPKEADKPVEKVEIVAVSETADEKATDVAETAAVDDAAEVSDEPQPAKKPRGRRPKKPAVEPAETVDQSTAAD